MQINNKQSLYVTLFTLVLVVCSSITVAVMLVIDKRDGFFSQSNNLTISFPANCPAYVTNKYYVEYYKVKLKVVFVSVIVVGLISLMLAVLIVVFKRKQLFSSKNNSKTVQQKQQNQNKDNKNVSNNNNNNNNQKQKNNNINGSKQSNLNNQSSLIIPPQSTDRSAARQMLLDKNNNYLSHQQSNLKNNTPQTNKTTQENNNNPQLKFPYTTTFFIPFLITILLFIVALANHLSFFIQWRLCSAVYDISQIKLIVYFGLQGLCVICGLIVLCISLFKRHSFFTRLEQEEQEKRKKLKQQEEERKKMKQKQYLNKNKGDKQLMGENKKNNQQAQQKASTNISSATNTNNNLNQNTNIVKGKPITNTNNNTNATNNKNNQQQISNTNNNPLNQNKHLKKQDISTLQKSKNVTTHKTKQTVQTNKTISNNTQLQQIKQVQSMYETNRSVNVETNNINNLNNNNNNNNNNNSVNYNNQNTINSKQLKDFNVKTQNIPDKSSTIHNNYQVPSYENGVIQKVFNTQNDVNKDQLKKQTTNNGQNAYKKANLQEIQMVEINKSKQSIVEQTIISIPKKQLLTPQKKLTTPQKQRKQLNLISSIYSIQQSSQFSSFTSNVVTSRVVNNGYQYKQDNYYNNHSNRQQSVDYRQYDNYRHYVDEDNQRYMTNRNHHYQKRENRQLANYDNDQLLIRRGSPNNNSQRYSATNKKMQMSQQLPYQQRYVVHSPKRRMYRQEQNDHYHKGSYQSKIKHNNYQQNLVKQQEINNKNRIRNPYNHHHLPPIPQKEQVYNPYNNYDESIINPVLFSGDDQSYRSGSSYYHNSIKKEINQSGDRNWDSVKDKNREEQKNKDDRNDVIVDKNRFQQQQRYYETQLNNFSNNPTVINKNIPSEQVNFNKNKSSNITNPKNITTLQPKTSNQTKLQKKQKKLKQHLEQQKLNKKNKHYQQQFQQQQLDKRVIQQSIKYLNQNNYNSVLNPVIEENKLLRQQQHKQQNQLQQKVFKQQMEAKRIANQKQKEINQMLKSQYLRIDKNQQIRDKNNTTNFTLIVPKHLQSSKVSINSNKTPLKLGQKRQKSKQQLFKQQLKTQQITKYYQNNQNTLVKYNDLYQYKNKVLKKRRNSDDININLQNYQPVIVKPTSLPKTNRNIKVSPTLPKREYLDPQFKANVILLTPDAIKDRKMSK